MQPNNLLISWKPKAVFNSLLTRVNSCSSVCSMYYSALSQLTQPCPNIAGMIKCQNNTNPSLILLLIQLHYIKDLPLLHADSEYQFLTFTCTIQQGSLPQNLNSIPCVTFHSSFSNGSWFFPHLISINKHIQTQNFLPKVLWIKPSILMILCIITYLECLFQFHDSHWS